jgi:diguanylate cyclase (GGDEF)-like protein/PAS domain S-box-containing protein
MQGRTGLAELASLMPCGGKKITFNGWAKEPAGEICPREGEIMQREERYRQLLDLFPDGILLLCAQRILFANRRAAELLQGNPGAGLVGRRLSEFLPRAMAEAVSRRIRRQASKAPLFGPFELRLPQPRGGVLDLEVRGASFCEAGQRVVQLTLRDISDRKALEERLRFLAQHDPLTGLPNRLLFDDRLRQAIARARRADLRFAVMLLDLNDFKDINDQLGHPIGDEMLRALGGRLGRCLRATDTAARLGGDEFGFVLDGLAGLNGLETIAERLLREIARPVRVAKTSLQVTGSLGLALFPAHGEEPEELIRRADAALYAAKLVGGGAFRHYAPEHERRVPEQGRPANGAVIAAA